MKNEYGFTKQEMEILDKTAKDWFGCDYKALDYDPEKQDEIYCYLADNGLI